MFYVSHGDVPPKRHTQHRAPDGSLYAAIEPNDVQPVFWSGKGPGWIVHLTTDGTVLGQWATEHIYAVGIGVTGTGDVYLADFYEGVFAGNQQGAVYRWSGQ